MTPEQEETVRQFARAAVALGLPLRPAVAWFENEVILATLVQFGGNVTEAARAMDFEREWLHRRAGPAGLLPWRGDTRNATKFDEAL